MPVDAVRAQGLRILFRVEEGLVVIGPGVIAGHLPDPVGQQLAGPEVLEADGSDAASHRVDREGHDGLVGAQVAGAEAVELVAPGHGGHVEKDFLRAGIDLLPAVEGVRLPGPVAAVVLVVPVTVGDARVILLDTAHDLVKEGLLQRLGLLQDRLGVSVLGFEVGDHGRVLPLPHPVVGIGSGVAVRGGDLVRNALGLGGLGCGGREGWCEGAENRDDASPGCHGGTLLPAGGVTTRSWPRAGSRVSARGPPGEITGFSRCGVHACRPRDNPHTTCRTNGPGKGTPTRGRKSWSAFMIPSGVAKPSSRPERAPGSAPSSSRRAGPI